MTALREPAPAVASARTVAEDFVRAQLAFEEALATSDLGAPLVFYRLRDVALAAQAFVEAVLGPSGIVLEPNGELQSALSELSRLANIHVLAFMQVPPTRVVHSGRAAAAVVSALLDAVVGDGFSPQGPA